MTPDQTGRPTDHPEALGPPPTPTAAQYREQVRAHATLHGNPATETVYDLPSLWLTHWQNVAAEPTNVVNIDRSTATRRAETERAQAQTARTHAEQLERVAKAAGNIAIEAQTKLSEALTASTTTMKMDQRLSLGTLANVYRTTVQLFVELAPNTDETTSVIPIEVEARIAAIRARLAAG